jgi:hypothetical protein
MARRMSAAARPLIFSAASFEAAAAGSGGVPGGSRTRNRRQQF